MDKLIKRVFKHNEILSSENFYTFIEKKKVVVFVPSKFLEILTSEMSRAGAGVIGNYEMCSFRTNGTGTFKPNKKAKPFTGKKNILSYLEEVKLEMECSPEQVSKVVSALLKNHPYDEAAYEIYDFMKRDEKPLGLTIDLKTKMSFAELYNRINKTKIELELSYNHELKGFAVINSEVNERIKESAKFINCKCIISKYKRNFKLIKM